MQPRTRRLMQNFAIAPLVVGDLERRVDKQPQSLRGPPRDAEPGLLNPVLMIEKDHRESMLARFRLDPVLIAIVTALALGLCLNLAGVPRPAALGTVSTAAMIAATVGFLLSIGMGLRLSRMSMYVRESAVISLIKFAFVPVIVTSLAALAGLGDVDGGIPLKVTAILSAMPVAMNALIPPSLFRLDLDLANACWVFTTLELVLVLPILIIILPLL